MAIRVMTLVWDSTVRAPERFTLLALADRADEDGKCWPSIPTLARKCRTGESTIRRHLKALVAQEVLTVEQRWNSSSLYVINLAKLRTLTDDTPSLSDTPPSQSDRGSRSESPSQSERTPPPNLSGPPSQSEHLSVIDPSGDPSGSPRKRGTRIPPGFTVTPEMVAWVRDRAADIDGKLETERFINYFESVPGAKGVKLDWVKTWKNWMLEEQKRAQSRQPSRLRAINGGGRPSWLPAHYDDDGVIRDPKTGVAIER